MHFEALFVVELSELLYRNLEIRVSLLIFCVVMKHLVFRFMGELGSFLFV